MKTFAPEFSALITILRSTGPVISTRRSSRSFGIGATVQSFARMSAVSGGKSGSAPASICVLHLHARGEPFDAGRFEPPGQFAEKLHRFGRQDLGIRGGDDVENLNAARQQWVRPWFLSYASTWRPAGRVSIAVWNV